MPRRIYFCSMNRAAHLPLVWGSLRAHVESNSTLRSNYVFEAPYFLLEQRQRAVDEPEEPFIYLLSCYVWNVRKNLEIAQKIKQRWPGVLVIAGGPSIPNQPESFFAEHPELDFAIHGEGELPLEQLLSELLEDQPDFDRVSALSHWRGAQLCTNPRRDRFGKHIDSPSPYLEGMFDEAMATARSLGHEPIALWETNRGCPYSCTFCDWGSANMSKLRMFDQGRLEREIDWFAENEIHSVLCADANFGILPRDLELSERLVARRNHGGFPRQFVTNYAKNARERVFDISRLFVGAGMAHGTILAMQSTDAEVLEAVRRSNIPFENYRALSAKFRREGIRTYTEIILGLPGESAEGFMRGLCRVLELGIHDDIMVYECVVLPNSQMNDPDYRASFGLDTIRRPFLHDDIEQVEVVVGHARLSREDWVEAYLFALLLEACHNLGLTQHLSRYLDDQGLASFADFYLQLFEAARAAPDSWIGAPLARLRALLERYLEDPSIPHDNKLLTQPDMVAVGRELMPHKRDWLMHEWYWVAVARDLDRFYDELYGFLVSVELADAPRVASLLGYQQDTVVSVDYDPELGRVGVYEHDWPSYFASDLTTLRDELTVADFSGMPEERRPGQSPVDQRREAEA